MKHIVLFLIRVYQNTWPFSGTACRFLPTCSHYTYSAIEKYGLIKGGWIGIKRISRCHPWSNNGFDEVP
ncbi:MAG: membrane protein insertion efficiency factor YidD [bacterium]|nr:membrane protein insertion efficiency factor YidD [bacterium]